MMYNKNTENMDENKYSFENVKDCLEHIVTDFCKWNQWGETAEICAVNLSHRGLGRFHHEMALKAHKDGDCFRKFIANKPYGYTTQPNLEVVHGALASAHYSEDKTVWHLDAWLKMLDESRDLFTEAAYYLSDCKEITLYRKLCDYLCRLENEMWAVAFVKDRITPTSLNHPDAYKVFEKLHIYFEQKYDGGKIDFDI